jgi:hypothetical protein
MMAAFGMELGGDIFFTRNYKSFGSEWRVIATQGENVSHYRQRHIGKIAKYGTK